MAIQSARIKHLNDAELNPAGAYVLYWMQQSQRAAYNHALEVAIEQANALGLPVLVCFGLTDGYPEANARHYTFMLQGLAEVATALEERGIAFAIRRGAPDAVALDLAQRAALLVCDRGYLKPQKAWRTAVARGAAIRVVQVEAMWWCLSRPRRPNTSSAREPCGPSCTGSGMSSWCRCGPGP